MVIESPAATTPVAPEVMALSFGQQGMMLARSMSPPGSMNIHAAFPLTPPPGDESTVKDLLRLLQARTDAFRAGVVARAGRPALQFDDLADVPPIELLTERVAGLGSWSFKPFGRRTTPLARAQLTERDGGIWLRLAIDCLVCDSWSIGMLTREVTGLYRFMAGHGAHDRLFEPPDDRPLGSFRAYLRNQGRHRTSEAIAAYRRFWESQLYPDATVELPRANAAASHHLMFAMPTGISSCFPELRHRLRTTDFCIFAAAFATALSHRSSQKSLVIYSEVADRTTPETLETIGALVNYVGIRVEIGRTLEETVRSCQIAVMKAMQFQSGPFFEIATAARTGGAVAVITPHGYLADDTHTWRDNCAGPTSVRAAMASGDAGWILEECSAPPMGDICLGFKPASWGYVTGLIFRDTFLMPDDGRNLASDLLAVLDAEARRQQV